MSTLVAPKVRWHCPACQGDLGGTLRKRQFCYFQCSRCRMAVLEPVPAPDASAQIYDASYFEGGHDAGYYDYVGDARHHEANANARLDQLAAAGIRGGALLELGSAAGFLLAAARSRGFAVTGVDVSPWARQRAAERSGAEVFATIDQVPRPPGGFQAVVMLQVLCHMPDAPAVLHAVRRLLAPEGRLLIETWDIESRVARWGKHRWQQVSPPSVIWLFSRDSIRRLLAAAGLEAIAFATPGKRVGLGLPLFQLLARLGAPGRLLFRMLEACGITRRSVHYRRKDLITVLARLHDGHGQDR